MSVETEIRTRLLADGTVSGLIGTRMYALILPQDPTLPALTFQRSSGPRIQQLNATSGWGRARIQIDCWAQGGDTATSGQAYVGAQTLAATVRASLDGFIGTLTTLKATIRLDNERDLHEEDVDLYRISQDYMVTHTEA